MAFSQMDFFKPLNKVKKEARENMKGSYKTSFYMNFMVDLVQLLIIVLAYILVDEFYRKTWAVVLTIVVLSFVFVFVTGTLFCGRSSYYFKILDQKENIFEPFKFFNNFWKYGKMYLLKMIKLILTIAVSGLVYIVIILILYKGMGDKFFEVFGITNYVTAGQNIFAVTGSIIKGIFASTPSSVWFCVFGAIIIGIPSVITLYKYSFVEYVMASDTKSKIKQCFYKSKLYTKNYRQIYLKFIGSFVLDYLLCIVTCGIYLIWFTPYFRTCKAILYNDLVSDF